MTPEEYRRSLDRLNWSIVGAAKYLGVTPRTAQNYAANGPPEPIARLLAYIEKYGPELAKEMMFRESGKLPGPSPSRNPQGNRPGNTTNKEKDNDS